jgi:hypothetical protein
MVAATWIRKPCYGPASWHGGLAAFVTDRLGQPARLKDATISDAIRHCQAVGQNPPLLAVRWLNCMRKPYALDDMVMCVRTVLRT